MYNHKPKDYVCPFCAYVQDKNLSHGVYRDKDILAFISSAMWPKNPGIVLIIPIKHYENIYEMPEKLLAKIQVLAKKAALGMKKGYKSDGVSTRQHNEPAGNQEVWHYHLQVVPRYYNDHLYVSHRKKTDIPNKLRLKYASIIRKFLKK